MSERETLLQRVERSRKDFDDENVMISWEEMEQAGLIEERPWKVVIAHIAAWQAIAFTEILKVLAGGKTEVDFNDREVVDRMNGVIADFARTLSGAAAVNWLYSANQNLVSLISTLDDGQLSEGSVIRNWVVAEAIDHYGEHLPGLRNYVAETAEKRRGKKI